MAKILNLELSFETHSSNKNFCVQVNQEFIVYGKKETNCVSLSIYIFSRMKYKMKDEMNSQK